MKKAASAAVVLLLTVLLPSCYSENDTIKGISNMLGVDLSKGTVIEQTDTHGGFNGDGDTYMVISLDADYGEIISREIKDSDRWRDLPMSDELQCAENKSMSKIKNGYYFFYNRADGCKDPEDDTQTVVHGSFNITAAVYDEENCVLYYYKLDT